MHKLPTALLVLTSTLPLANARALSLGEPPTMYVLREDFQRATDIWAPAHGTWVVRNGVYISTLTGGTDLTRVTQYDGPEGGIDTTVHVDDYTASARVINLGHDDTHQVGLVYGYQDPQNYYEVSLSALGNVRIRSVINGVTTDELPDVVSFDIPRDTWCQLEVHWKNGQTIAKVNGQALQPVSQPELTDGQVGLVTHAAVGRFDKVAVGIPLGDQPFLETFAGAPSVTFAPQSGQWDVVAGTYRNSAVQQKSITLAPIHTGLRADTGDTISYTLRTRMFNPWGASGNTMGLVFNYESNGAQYDEVIFTPTGIARLNRFENGRLTTLATASYTGGPKVPFDVALENEPNHMAVRVDGVPIFEDVPGVNPFIYPQGGVGLITHWDIGRFDNVQFDHGIFEPCSLALDTPPPSSWIVSGTWFSSGGTLNNGALESSNIVDFDCAGNDVGVDAGTNEVYSARLFNQYGSSGNLVGLTYNYQREGFYAGDYYEVVFSSNQMQLRKVIEGVRYLLTSRTINVPQKTWFDVQVIRSGIATTIKVNGDTVLDEYPQGALQGGDIGVVTHWSKGRFDNVSLSEM